MTLTTIGILISFLLILIISLRVPPQDVGLSSFANKSNLLGSPSSAQRFLDILTVTAIIIYVLIAFKLNITYSKSF
jgi:preprotein translocase subunit SecG